MYTPAVMFCPICKSEYREGFATCSDCHVALVSEVPEPDSPVAYQVLWSGESAVFQDQLLDSLEKEKIGAVGIPRDILFRNSGDMLGMQREPRFGFAVCVQIGDFPAASTTLEQLLHQEPSEISQNVESIPLSVEELAITAELPLKWNPDTASIEVWRGEEDSQVRFIEDALHGVGVPTARLQENGNLFRLMVRPQEEARAKEVVRQIQENTAPDKALPGDVNLAWLDEPVASYSLIWVIGAAYLLLVIMSIFFPELARRSTSPLGALLGLATFVSNIGFLWMLYQSARYELRPFSFVVLSFIPFAFVWYYFERYKKRSGVRRLPVAIRMHISPPPST